MTPDEINRAIAESVGWSDLKKGPYDGTYFGRYKDHTLNPIPNYHGDLNEIRKVVLAIPNHQKSRFVVELSRLNTGAETFSFEHRFKCATHDAPDFCTAYLRTIGEWRVK